MSSPSPVEVARIPQPHLVDTGAVEPVLHPDNSLGKLLLAPITIGQAIAWASSVANQLTVLHESGKCHGQVSAGHVLVQDGSAVLTAPSPRSSSTQSEDILHFAYLLREMLGSVQALTDAGRNKWTVLDRIAMTNSQVGSGGRMKKVASALKLLGTVPASPIPRIQSSVKAAPRKPNPFAPLAACSCWSAKYHPPRPSARNAFWPKPFTCGPFLPPRPASRSSHACSICGWLARAKQKF